MWGTLAFGRICYHGRQLFDDYADQADLRATYGSSGSAMFLEDASKGYPVLGIVHGGFSRGSYQAMHYIPMRRILQYAKTAKIEWAFNHTLPAQSLEQIRKATTIEVYDPALDDPKNKKKEVEKKK